MSQNPEKSLCKELIPEVELPDFIKYLSSSENTQKDKTEGPSIQLEPSEKVQQKELLFSTSRDAQGCSHEIPTRNQSVRTVQGQLREIEEDFDANMWPQGSNFTREEKTRIYSRNYREKMKDKQKALEEENRFLKKKVEDLTFRLREAQLQISRLKHDQINKPTTYHSIKQKCLKEAQQAFENGYVERKKISKLQEELTSIFSLDNRDRVDLLNYHMGEILENMAPDSSFYFIDSLIKKTGVWGSDRGKFSKLDHEVYDIIGLSFEESKSRMSELFPPFMQRELIKFYQFWRDFYQAYIKLINQNFFIESATRLNEEKWNQFMLFEPWAKMELHFEKIKYRKDLRQIKQSWFAGYDVDHYPKTFIQELIEQPTKKVHSTQNN